MKDGAADLEHGGRSQDLRNVVAWPGKAWSRSFPASSGTQLSQHLPLSPARLVPGLW